MDSIELWLVVLIFAFQGVAALIGWIKKKAEEASRRENAPRRPLPGEDAWSGPASEDADPAQSRRRSSLEEELEAAAEEIQWGGDWGEHREEPDEHARPSRESSHETSVERPSPPPRPPTRDEGVLAGQPSAVAKSSVPSSGSAYLAATEIGRAPVPARGGSRSRGGRLPAALGHGISLRDAIVLKAILDPPVSRQRPGSSHPR